MCAPLVNAASCENLFSNIGTLDQHNPAFEKMGLIDACTGRSNLCAPVSAINGLPRILGHSLTASESVDLVNGLVRGSGIDLASVISRGFWPFEIEHALEQFFLDKKIGGEVRAVGIHAFANNWDASVFAANVEKRQLPDLAELTQFLARSDAFTLVNFLGFTDSQHATVSFDPTRALEDFQQGKIFMAHYLTIDNIVKKGDASITASAQDPMNGRVEFEMIPFEHPFFGSRIYRLKFLQPQSDRTFLVSALVLVNKK